jgi:hypothetical protein
MPVKCGKGHTHQSITEVRACYGVDGSEVATTQQTFPTLQKAGATERQVSFIATLRKERGMAGPEGEQLTKREASAIIDKLMAIKVPKATGNTVAAPTTNVPRGTYTIVARHGDYRTLQIEEAGWADGKIVASYLSGPDNETAFTSFAFVDDRGITPFKRFRENSELVADLQFLLEDANKEEAHERFFEEAEKYAMASGNCMRCRRKLTVPSSLHRGLGPVCANREGLR